MITVAYVGFGVSVREYHIPYVENREDVRVKYVYRRQEDIAQFAEYEPFYPEITFTTDFQEVLQDQTVDLVVVAAPDQFHVSYAKEILNAGKHALIEKPFAPTAEEARQVFALAKEKGLVCMPNQNRRFDADFLAVRQVLESGKLGAWKAIMIISRHMDGMTTWEPCIIWACIRWIKSSVFGECRTRFILTCEAYTIPVWVMIIMIWNFGMAMQKPRLTPACVCSLTIPALQCTAPGEALHCLP